MNWKIAQIEISSFKAFKHISLDLGTSSLLTLDGPNGYGKTSIFDAVELLLTGQIKRIHDLFATLMTRKQKNYDDNLFWNTRSGKQDLSIKIELVDGEHRLVIARHTPVIKFDTKSNNRADEFNLFSLYELPTFDSTAYTENNKRNDEFLGEIFGQNFRENFSFLNYLEQGQNKLLHTRVDERKEALGNLFNTSDIATEIENCKSVATKITKHLGDAKRKSKEAALEFELIALRETLEADIRSVEYKKLSTTDSAPYWDKEVPFTTYDQDVYIQSLASIHKLINLLPQKAAVRIRTKNEAIEADINRHAESLISLANLGSDISKLEELDKTEKEIDQLALASANLKRGASFITAEQAKTLPGWETDRLEWFERQITTRNDLKIKNTANDRAAAELARLRQQLLELHTKHYPNDKYCPLCGNDWEAHASMLNAVDERAQKITDALGKDGKALLALINHMTTELSPLGTYIEDREAALNAKYDHALHEALKKAKSRLPVIQELIERLNAEEIKIDFAFNNDESVITARLEELRNLMRANKTNEAVELPEDWQQTINSVFKEVQDFYILDPQVLIDKERYFKVKNNEAQSIRLKKCQEELQKIQRENEAAGKAKDKVTRLYVTLKEAEEKYADQTISEIELIFHIYSGRLIQNYQRGLGLFIDSRDGKQLRFLTAEKSVHDAMMSMSTGQVSALSLAFFLSLNKVYSKVPIILIDDPFQSLDEVNVASLTDLLRCELNHCQLIVSSHEEDISAYMRYRFNRAGLTTSSLNMQKLVKGA